MSKDKIKEKITPRAEAKALGSKLYFTGKLCIHGHISQRYTTTGKCLTCTQNEYIENKQEHLRKSKIWREQNKQADIERRRKYREKNKEKAKIGHENWRIKNREKIRKKYRLWRQENVEKERLRNRIYTKNNPLQAKANGALRRARKLNAEGRYFPSDIQNLITEQNNTCNGCGVSFEESDYHIDHKNPLSKGGSNWPWNLQLLCPHCNFSKSNKDFEEWKAYRFKCE